MESIEGIRAIESGTKGITIKERKGTNKLCERRKTKGTNASVTILILL